MFLGKFFAEFLHSAAGALQENLFRVGDDGGLFRKRAVFRFVRLLEHQRCSVPRQTTPEETFGPLRLVDHDLAGLSVVDVVTVGKHLFTRFDDGRSLHSHFRLDGSWHLYRPGMAWRRPAHEARAVLATDERVAVGFALHDLELLPTADEQRLVGHLGPDLLDPEWSDAHAAEALRRLTARGDSEIGLVLLEQRVMAGIGNLYKTETCFLRGLSPWTPTRRPRCWGSSVAIPSGSRIRLRADLSIRARFLRRIVATAPRLCA